ncbi:NADPH:quinone oxidoreductase family protein [Sphingomonas sp.]|jgi:NADPH:quinone reductase-like Zn-dependent oxidoreductase|uniref:NADPH:quinone oxidoreductase family protein n=1 Tax=Sphingomonas sp. TaxID=28214 RepID=UPI00260D1A23|nr:NADPH:quinone oxidoreductase family protein [Sphingomonas sp.]MDF2604636.1 zinc-binding alcohol dehydrogenase [Sphingomonas sp.]
MRALLSRAPGGPETLEIGELPDPVAKPGEVIVAVKACAINYPDVLIIQDKYQFKPPRPFAPGGEVSGVVESVGEGVTAWKPGDRVMGNTGNGGLVEKIAMKADNIYAIPDERSFEEGAAMLLTYGTTIHALVDRGNIKAGDNLLVLGAAGGVGLAAVELGKAFGARVVGAVSSEEKAQAVRDAGADDVIIYGRAPFSKDESKALADAFKEKAGKNGFDVIYDAVGGDYAEPALRSIAWEGRYLVIGFPAGIPKIALNLTLLKSCDIRGVFWGAYAAREPVKNRASIKQLFDLWAEGKIAPKVTEIFPFDRGGDAIRKMESRAAIGKLVVRVAD